MTKKINNDEDDNDDDDDEQEEEEEEEEEQQQQQQQQGKDWGERRKWRQSQIYELFWYIVYILQKLSWLEHPFRIIFHVY